MELFRVQQEDSCGGHLSKLLQLFSKYHRKRSKAKLESTNCAARACINSSIHRSFRPFDRNGRKSADDPHDPVDDRAPERPTVIELKFHSRSNAPGARTHEGVLSPKKTHAELFRLKVLADQSQQRFSTSNNATHPPSLAHGRREAQRKADSVANARAESLAGRAADGATTTSNARASRSKRSKS